MLELKNITKKYGKHLVLDSVNLNFQNPEGVYGILGRNGVGKTTLMKIIFNMIPNYQGEITVNGVSAKDNGEILKDIVYVGGEIYKNNVLFQGKIKDIFKAYSIMYASFDRGFAEMMLDSYGIKLKNKFNKLSTGNRTLVQNTIGLATRAPITILDEPTNGLDSVNRQNFFRFMMEDYEKHPRLFMLSTHLIQEVENYLTNVVILKDAQVLVEETLEEVQKKAHIISNYPLENKHVISEARFGTRVDQIIYEELTNDEVDTIKASGGDVQSLDLQSLFNALVEK